MTKKAPIEVLSPSDLVCMSTLNERDRQWFMATWGHQFQGSGAQLPQVGKIMETSILALQNGR